MLPTAAVHRGRSSTSWLGLLLLQRFWSSPRSSDAGCPREARWSPPPLAAPPGMGPALVVGGHKAARVGAVAPLRAIADTSLAVAFGASMRSLGEVATSLVIGAFAYRSGVLGPEGLAVLSKLYGAIFIPALLFGRVARTAASLQAWGVESWLLLIPLCAPIQIGIQLLLSRKVLRWVAGVDPDSTKGRIMRVAMSYQNSALPLLFCQALFRRAPDNLLMAEGAISFYLIGWTCMFWTLGVKIMEDAPPEDGSANKEAKRTATVESVQPVSLWPRIRRHLPSIINPPICGAMAGLAFGLTPFLRWLMVPYGARVHPPPMAFVFHGIENVGLGALPTSQLVLSGSLALSLDRKSAVKCGGAGPGLQPEERWRLRELLTVCGARILLGPVFCGFIFCSTLQALGVLPIAHGTSKVLAVVLLLESFMPTTPNSIVIPNVLGRRRMASAMAQLLLAVYVVALPCAGFWLSIGLFWTGL